MTAETAEERKAKLLKRKQQIEKRLKDIDTREIKKLRKADTRKKILAGALCLTHAEHKPEFKKWLMESLAETLTKPADRALFGLDEPEKPAESSEAPSASFLA